MSAAQTASPASIELPAPSATKLLRYPDIHGDSVVFVHGGDLWKASVKGGVATRLTAHPGVEIFPKFSPDGKWIAFTGQYDGDEQVYVIPADGGVPRQLTFYPAAPSSYGSDNLVYGWTPDGKNVLFRSMRDANAVTETGTLYTVPLSGGLPVKVGPPTSGAGAFSPDGTKLVFTPTFRDFRSWKRYQGGMAQNLVIYDLKTRETKRVDNNLRTEREPVWLGDRIYFTSDRTGKMNIFAYDTVTGKITQQTREGTWDVRWASGDGKSRIVFELAGELHVFDTAAPDNAPDRIRKLDIHVPSDGLAMRPRRVNAGSQIESAAAAPGGKRVAIAARGDVFTAPIEKGYPRNLTNSSNAHEREPVWSHDGKILAYISDVSGEDQIHLRDPRNPDAAAVALTRAFKSRLTHLTLAPDGANATVLDAANRLWLVPLRDNHGRKRGVPAEIVHERRGGSPDVAWSPCSSYVALTLATENESSRIHIYDLRSRKLRPVTDPLFDAHSPAWDPAGRNLYYLTQRDYIPQLSTVEWNFATTRGTSIAVIPLQKDAPNPFGLQLDDDTSPIGKGKEAKPAAPASTAKKSTPAAASNPGSKAAATKPGAGKTKKKNAPGRTRIDWDGLGARAIRVPLDPGNYAQLAVTATHILYVKRPAATLGGPSAGPATLNAYDIKERKSAKLAETSRYSIAPDHSKLLYHTSNGALQAIDPRPDAKPVTLRTDNLYADSIPALEWREMYEETWRKFRDHFYVSNMHGYDWEALGGQYRALLPHVAHRDDLTYILRELVGELNIGHAYVMGGEQFRPARPAAGLPGVTFALDQASNRYRIAKIYAGQNEEPKYRSPLTLPGVAARVGDYVLAVDGIPLTGNENPYQLLRRRGDPVTLTLNSRPEIAGKGVRHVTYAPLDSERALRYLEFTTHAREQVAKATKGRAGYLHIPNMGAEGAYEFIKWYYPQLRKEGLVIDVRANGGGNISQWIIMRLNQKLLGTRFGGPNEVPDAYPHNARHGHQVCIINENAGSDGDIFPHYFRAAGLGPLVGKRTWGGVVGISGVGPLLDGGTVFVPLRGTNDTKGNWIIEGKGVPPDIEVENDPKSVSQGRDPQLERSIEELVKRMDAQPRKWPSAPKPPVKTK
ncbi:MAG: PDZ domain-containing protein [Puniceicoccales bacterium]|nr:PDZ domain-containing protein [Puniceicoccales bacterium]